MSLENMKKELHERKQLLIKKDHESSELQKMLNDQREYMEKERVNLNDRLSTVEVRRTYFKVMAIFWFNITSVVSMMVEKLSWKIDHVILITYVSSLLGRMKRQQLKETF